MIKSEMKRLLLKEENNIHKLNHILSQGVEEESSITQKVYQQSVTSYTSGERIADKVATFGGSWRFIILFGAFITLWISINTIVLINRPFDPYPFILLNLILSCIAALQAPVIMMSQNRKEAKDRKRAEDDYLINLKAEIEIRNLHQKVDHLIANEMKNLFEIQKIQCDLLEKLEKHNSLKK